MPLINGDCEFETMDGVSHKIEGQWDLLIAHPPCTYLTNASAVRMRVKGEIVPERYEKAMEAKEFFMQFYNANCDKICVENPTPLKLVNLPPYTQAIQPWQFGHPYTKRTCLWLKGLPPLVPTEIITDGITPYVNGGIKMHMEITDSLRAVMNVTQKQGLRLSKESPAQWQNNGGV